jgi:mono/diheme cytochrome c family protein
MVLPRRHLSLVWGCVLLALSALPGLAEVDFHGEVMPLFERKCLKCHGPEKSKGGLRLDNRAAALKGGEEGVSIIPGNGAGSLLVELVEEEEMPPKGAPLTKGEINLLRSWIDEGARWPNVVAKRNGPERVTPASPSSPAHVKEGTTISLPPADSLEVDFTQDIQPLLQRSCIKCHGPEKPKGRFRLDNRESALKGGAEGVAIQPGNSADSPLIHFVAGLVEDMEMPPTGEGTPLTAQEIGILRAWIDQGAKWGEGEGSSKYAFYLNPTMRWYSVSGNEQKFREHAWLREGWSGGLGRITLEKWVDLDTKLTAEGLLDAPGNYELTMSLDRQDVGFVRGGFEHHRSYDNNYGGYYGPFDDFSQSAFQLDRDLEMDRGRVWAELGLTRPNWPELTLGYEYRFRDGAQSTLHWGPSTQGGNTRNIYPAYKRVREDVHLLWADVKYDWGGLEMENNFMIEYFDLETTRVEAGPFGTEVLPSQFTSIDESHDSFQLTNTFSLQKQIKDWWLLSGGYYYSYLDADAAFQQTTFNGSGQTVVGQHWFSQPIVIDWNTHIGNVSTRLGPWEGLTLSAGLQGNWERQHAVGDATLFFGLPDSNVPIPGFFSSTMSSNKQSVITSENFSLRYDRIPHTVLFAEAEWEQDDTDYFEHDPGALQGFRRDTESRNREQDYRAGINLSPWRRVSLNAHYRYRDQEDRYDHLRDEGRFGAPGEGYSAFILGRDVEMHEFQTRLNLRPKPWLRTMLTYQLQKTDYETDTEAVTQGAPSDTPGGWLLAGEYDASILSLSVDLTPWQRLSLNSSFTLHDSNTQTANNEDPAVEDFEGEVYTFMLGGSYMMDEKTDFTAHYFLSKGDFSQDNEADGIPLGIEYEQHGFQAGVSTKIGDHARVQLQYLLQDYQEPSSGGWNDYTAHGIMANYSWDW